MEGMSGSQSQSVSQLDVLGYLLKCANLVYVFKNVVGLVFIISLSIAIREEHSLIFIVHRDVKVRPKSIPSFGICRIRFKALFTCTAFTVQDVLYLTEYPDIITFKPTAEYLSLDWSAKYSLLPLITASFGVLIFFLRCFIFYNGLDSRHCTDYHCRQL